jgi:hypothetical protein
MSKKLDYWYQFNWNKNSKECFVVFYASEDPETNLEASKSFSDIIDVPKNGEKKSKEEIVKELMQYTADNELFVVYETLGGCLNCQIGQFRSDGQINTTFGTVCGRLLTPNYDGTFFNDEYHQFHWFVTAEEALEYMSRVAKQRMNDWKKLVDTRYKQKRTIELIAAKLKKRNKAKHSIC